MSCKSLLALSLVGGLVWLVTGSVLANPCPPPAPVCPPAYAPAPVYPPACAPAPVYPPACAAVPPPPWVSPGELPELEAPPNRHTLTIVNGACVTQQNFVERYGSWRNTGEFTNYDILFRDSPRVPWRYYGTYYSARSAADAAGVLRANGNQVSVRPHCA